MAEGGGRKSASGSGETTDPDLLGYESRESDRMGGIMAYLRGMRKGDGLKGRGKIQEPWWRHAAEDKQLMDTLENILAAERARQQR